eukprot:gene10028-11870_t
MAAEGGGINLDLGAEGMLENATLCDNVASIGDGGGIFVKSATSSLLVIGSLLCNNSAAHQGGAVHSSSTVTIAQGSWLKDNTALAEGGGVHAGTASSVMVSASTVSHNTAWMGGGVFCSDHCKLLVTNASRIEANSAALHGGGVYLARAVSGAVSAASSVLHNSVGGGSEKAHFSEQEEGSWGGGVYLGELSNVSIMGSVVTNNSAPTGSAGFGGGISVKASGALRLVNTEVSWNVAGLGGGLHGASNSTLQLDGCVVAANRGLVGGGVRSLASVVVRDSALRGNYAEQDGGGIFGERVTLHRSLVEGNQGGSSGGGMFATKYVEILASTITQNVAVHGGGGVSFSLVWLEEPSDGVLWMSESVLSWNRAVELGGGMALTSSQSSSRINARVERGCLVMGNFVYSGSGGGMAVLVGVAAVIDNSTLKGNQAYVGGNLAMSSGGALSLLETSKLRLTDHSVLEGNLCHMIGGGIYMGISSEALIDNGVHIRDSGAVREGGGIGMMRGEGPENHTRLRMERAEVSNNTALYYSGGGIAADWYCRVELAATTVSNNTAGYSGGGMSVLHSTVNISGHSVFSYNTAWSGGGLAVTGHGNLPRGMASRPDFHIRDTVFLANQGLAKGGAMAFAKTDMEIRIGQASGVTNAESPNATWEWGAASSQWAHAAQCTGCSVCFLENMAEVGSAVHLQEAINITLASVLLSHSKGLSTSLRRGVVNEAYNTTTVLHLEAAQAVVSESHFEHNVGSAIYVNTNSSVTVSATKIINHTAPRGAALFVHQGCTAVLTDCQLVNGSAEVGGAMHSAGHLQVARSRCEGNHAVRQGGCLYIELNGQSTHLTNSSFRLNRASGKDGTEGSGGVIYLTTAAEGSAGLNSTHLHNLSARGNYAAQGGAFGFWQPSDPSQGDAPRCVECDVAHESNRAAYEDPEGWATPAQYLEVDPLQSEETGHAKIVHTIAVRIVDANREVVTVDQSSFVELRFANPSACSLQEGSVRLQVVNGVASFPGDTELMLKGNPGTRCEVFFESDLGGLYPSKVASNITVIPLRYCRVGEELAGTDPWQRCLRCPEGYLSLSNSTPCIPCAQEMHCADDDTQCPLHCPGGDEFVVCQGAYVAPQAAHCAADTACVLQRAYLCEFGRACTTNGGAELCTAEEVANSGRVGRSARSVASLQ